MKTEAIFITDVPPEIPGLLFKIFVSTPGVDIFYQPFWPHLDLFSKYTFDLRGDTRIPAGYFDRYFESPELFLNYPKTERPATVAELIPFLRDCIRGARGIPVFDISGYEKNWAVLEREFSIAKRVQYDGNLNWADDFSGCASRILSSVGLFVASDLNPSSDWVKLIHMKQGLPISPFQPFCSPTASRSDVKTILDQFHAILQLGGLDTEVASLKIQLANVKSAAEERLKLKEQAEFLLNEASQNPLRLIKRKLTRHFRSLWS